MNEQVWKNNLIQFPRLLDEVAAVGLTPEQYAGMQESMDLSREMIDELFARATEVRDQDTHISFNPKEAHWRIVVNDVTNDVQVCYGKKTHAIHLPETLPLEIRLHIAGAMVFFLNTDARTR